ncbi:hypothetical protein C4J84_0730 [Pseudomonas sp. R11-23-07]|nr:hypothetical protein C4J84_0730 [Pseudomonas sp. R11-23-07]
MSNLAWARWWAAPWLYAHADWKSTHTHAALVDIHRRGLVATGTHYGITPCLPTMPDPALLQLAIASCEQLELGLALIDGICRPSYAAALDEHHLLWCNSLSKALCLDIVQPDKDPLQLLRAWIPPAAWQRLRLRFARRRVLDLEEMPLALNGSHSRLDTLWHAVVWRIGTLNLNSSACESWPQPQGD